MDCLTICSRAATDCGSSLGVHRGLCASEELPEASSQQLEFHENFGSLWISAFQDQERDKHPSVRPMSQINAKALTNTAALTVRLICALSDLNDVPVRVADVATNLTVLGDWFRDELGPATLP